MIMSAEEQSSSQNLVASQCECGARTTRSPHVLIRSSHIDLTTITVLFLDFDTLFTIFSRFTCKHCHQTRTRQRRRPHCRCRSSLGSPTSSGRRRGRCRRPRAKAAPLTCKWPSCFNRGSKNIYCKSIFCMVTNFV